MTRPIETRSEFEKKVNAGEVILEPPRQPGRDAATGRFVSNKRLPGMLPTFLIRQQMNITFYNDIDVEAFKREVREQVSRIQDDIREDRFSEAGISYQQFIDQYDDCFAMPSPEGFEVVRRRGIDLYATLERQGTNLTEELHLQNNPDAESLRRFSGITDAHINLFFYMLELNLALCNKIDIVQGQLLKKLAQLENRLTALLKIYIYGDRKGNIGYDDIPASKTLYGWILLEQNNLRVAMEIYDTDPVLRTHEGFAELHEEVFDVYKTTWEHIPISSIKREQFNDRGLTNLRVEIAQKLCYYLQQIQQIRQYIDELTHGSDAAVPAEATVDIRSLLNPQPPE
ncbi:MULTISPECIES: hypothetical protein [unclassified Cedecea]|uniref:hypothetical protein n=1 Tax=unclassified Cedecea TaxID=2649846 RepID=UPI0030197A2C